MNTGEFDEGFTFIEVLFAVLIIGFLSSIAFSSFGYIRQSSFEAAVHQDVRNAGGACEEYFVDNHSYPAFGPFTGLEGTSNFDIAPNYSIKVSQGVTIQGVLQPQGGIVITGTHPGSTQSITYISSVGQ